MRVIATTGLAVLAGLAVSAGPAQATATAGAEPGASGTQQHFGRDGIAGYFRTLGACEFAGRVGEHFGRWDDYDCDLVRVGFRRGVWALEVDRDDRWSRFGHGHGSSGRPSGTKDDDAGYGAKGNGAKDDNAGYGAKGNDAKDDGVKDDGYGAKGNNAKDNGTKSGTKSGSDY